MAELLTAESVPAYVASLDGVLPEASTAVEISGGNLNYAFRVSDAQGASVFLKQTPGFVKVLGSEAKLSNERLITERRAYVEWAMAIGSGPATACLPRLHHFDSERMVLVMEHLGSCVLLHERLMGGSADGGVGLALGSFLGAAHASTHVTLVSPERAAELTSAFANEELRGLQLEYVFSKCYREAERAATLREDATFMAAVEALKAAYRGEIATNLALCHGDLHAGSVMVAPGGASVMRMASAAPPIVKVIDPEFAIYGPPGLDLGCLFSSYVLAALARSVALGTTRDERARELGELRDAVAAIWEAYTGAMSERGVPAAVLEAISADAAGFAGCEVARTALGFAGVRGLPIEDADVKAKAEATALDIAVRCIRGRSAGVAGILAEIEEILQIEGVRAVEVSV